MTGQNELVDGGATEQIAHYRSLRDDHGRPLVWREPDPGRDQYGFLDAYNVDRGWVATDYVAIDQGPLLLAIENARTGLVWRLFHDHPRIRSGMARLGLTRDLGAWPVKSGPGS